MIEHEGWPVVAIVGRPNVGKSTLLNRIVGRREAIVEEKPGVTRDRKEVEAEWNGRQFIAVDTGGWLPSRDSLDAKVSEQSERAMRSADVIMLVVDATVGVIEEDAQVANVLRKLDRPVVVVANKIDDANREASMWDFLEFGLGEPSAISALHGRGTGDLLDRLVALLPDEAVAADPVEDEDGDDDVDAGPRVFAVAIVGRPNVGKSTLFNRLIGDERAVVHDMPGTTRDAIDTVVETDEGPIRFVDTAGMRRRSRIGEGTEYYSLVRAPSRRPIRCRAARDRRDRRRHRAGPAARRAHRCGRMSDRDPAEQVGDARRRRPRGGHTRGRRKLHFTANSVVLKVSALTGKGVHRLLPALGEAIEAYHTRIPTKKVNDVVRAAQSAQPAPHGARVLYATQGAADPPTFTLFANRELPPTYLRYLERKLREAFDLGPTPIKLRVRRRSE